MNQGDCFILDTGKEIFVYVGPQAKGTERLKAINVANQVRDQDHSGRAKVNIVGKSNAYKIILNIAIVNLFKPTFIKKMQFIKCI